MVKSLYYYILHIHNLQLFNITKFFGLERHVLTHICHSLHISNCPFHQLLLLLSNYFIDTRASQSIAKLLQSDNTCDSPSIIPSLSR
jgi:hypothetical protein